MTYAGARLQPSYGLFGAMLYQGEPFYKQRFYNRTDISYGIIRRRSVDLRAELNFNITPGVSSSIRNYLCGFSLETHMI